MRRNGPLVVLAGTGVALGLAAERSGFGWDDPAHFPGIKKDIGVAAYASKAIRSSMAAV